jgi:hypothetical protein
LKREKSDLLACSFRARAAPESKLKPEPLGEAGFDTVVEELSLLPLLGPDENFVPDPAE